MKYFFTLVDLADAVDDKKPDNKCGTTLNFHSQLGGSIIRTAAPARRNQRLLFIETERGSQV